MANTVCWDRPSSMLRRSKRIGAAEVASQKRQAAAMSSAAKDALAHRVRRASVAFQHCNGHILTVIEVLRLGCSEPMLRTLLKWGRDWFLV
jgi:hypothetical protein